MITHFEMKNIIIFIIILISNNVKGQSGKLSRIYDFEIEIDFIIEIDIGLITHIFASLILKLNS